MPDTSRIIEASMVLRAESTRGWQEFVLAMREYAATVTAEMIRCPPEHLPRAQGMAIQANELASLLNEAAAHYDKIRAMRMARPVQRSG